MTNFGEYVGFIWSIAEILRGNYKQSEYGKVVLPFTVLQRLDQSAQSASRECSHAERGNNGGMEMSYPVCPEYKESGVGFWQSSNAQSK